MANTGRKNSRRQPASGKLHNPCFKNPSPKERVGPDLRARGFHRRIFQMLSPVDWLTPQLCGGAEVKFQSSVPYTAKSFSSRAYPGGGSIYTANPVLCQFDC